MTTCPTCGSPVRVVSSDGGTSHYEPVAALLREALEDMVNQFAYWSESDPPGQITGGLSALEGAFAALGYDEPHPADHLRCDEPGCRKQSSAGTPTMTGYRRTCHEHYPEAAGAEWMAAWRAYQRENPTATYSEWAALAKTPGGPP